MSTSPTASTGHVGNSHSDSVSERRILAGLSALVALGVILQGLWAGIFLSQDDRPEAWVRVHDLGAKATLVLSVLAAVWALWRLRRDRVIAVASVLVVVLVAVEAHLGGMITEGGTDSLTAVHVPLAMILLAVTVWLPLRALRAERPE